MSSQGPRIDPDATVDHNVPVLDPAFGTPSVSKGYQFTKASIRDGSDWIAYKRQLLTLNELKPELAKDPWFVKGNDYRLQKLQGQYKKPEECDGCDGGAFLGDSLGGGGNQGRIYLGRQNAKTVNFYGRPQCEDIGNSLDTKYYTVYTFIAPTTGFYDVSADMPSNSESFMFISNVNVTLSSSDILNTMRWLQCEGSISDNIQNFLDIYPGSNTLQTPVYMNTGDSIQLLLLPYYSPESKFTTTFYVLKNTIRANLGFEMFVNTPDIDIYIYDPTNWGTRDDSKLSNLLTYGDDANADGMIVAPKNETLFENTTLRMYGFITPKVTGDYTFYVTHDDSFEMYINGEYVYQNSTPSEENSTNTVFLYQGKKYPVEMLWKNGGTFGVLQIPYYDVYDGSSLTEYYDFNSLCSRTPDLFVPRELFINPLYGIWDTDDDYDIIYTGNTFTFTMDGTTYGDNGDDYIYLSSNNVLYFGNGNSYNPSSYENWLNNAANGPAILLGAGDKYTPPYMQYYTDVQTVGDYQYIGIMSAWNDLDYNLEDGITYVQIRLIRNTVTGEQWIEYKTELMTNLGTPNIWEMYLPNNPSFDLFKGAFSLSNPAPGSSFLLYDSDGAGRNWTFQNNKSFTLA